MADFESFKVGAFLSPLTPSTAHGLLEDADPALAVTLAFYAAVLETHLGARWNAEVTKAGLPALAGKLAALAIPYDPLPFLTAAAFSPPFLALYTATERPSERTRHFYRIEADWKLLLVLPALTAAQYLQLSPFLRASSKVILDRTEQGFEPTYQGGARFMVAAGLEQLRIESVRYGNIAGTNANLFFPTLEMDITASERRMPTPGLQALDGLDGSTAVADPAGNVDVSPFALPLT